MSQRERKQEGGPKRGLHSRLPLEGVKEEFLLSFFLIDVINDNEQSDHNGKLLLNGSLIVLVELFAEFHVHLLLFQVP